MSAQDSFTTLKTFFETRNASRQALAAIKEGVEIGIVIGDTVECALFRQGDQPVVENRPAKDPDVIFTLKPESVEILSSRTKDEIGDIGIAILKEVLAGEIRIQVPGRIWNLVNRGYFEMLLKGGSPVASYLMQNGLAGVPKILSAIKGLKRRT